MASSQQGNLTSANPATQTISLVGSLGISSNPIGAQNVNILQNQLTPQQLAAFQSQQVAAAAAAQQQAAAGLRPAVVNLNVGNQPVAALQNVQLLGAVRESSANTVPVNIITTGGQTFVQAVTSNPSLPQNPTVLPNQMVRTIAPNAAAVVNQLQASQLVQQMRGNNVSLQQQPQQSMVDASRVNSASPSVAQNKPVQQVNRIPIQHAAPQPTSSNSNQVLTKRKLQDLLHEIDPSETMDDDVEEVLLQVADDFIENVISSSCQIAKNRKSNTLDVKDIQLHLDRNWNMWVPGYGNDDIRPYKKLPSTEAHRQRMALIKKALKK